MQPHIRRGRFFNQANDRLVHRFGHEIKSLAHLVGKSLIRKITHTVSHHQKKDDWVACTKPPATSLDPLVTWLGHATFLIQLNDVNILTDPVFDQISPFFFPRITQMPIAPHEMPKIHVVIISHNHRDHMDESSLLALKKDQPMMLVPLGNKRWFIKRGFTQVIEMNWWDQHELKSHDVTFSFLPANHWTGRGIFDFNKTLWGSWMIQSSRFTLYFAGDTAYGKHFVWIKENFSSIDVALMPVGPNEPRSVMVNSHVSTQEAVQAFFDLQAHAFVPMHWGTFKSGFDLFADPINQLYDCWQRHELALERLHVLKFGEQRLFNSITI